MTAAAMFGEFFDALSETKIIDGQAWLEDWQERASEAEWKEIRTLPLTADLVRTFIADIVTMFQARMRDICTDALYAQTMTEGHAFLEEIRDTLHRFGINDRDLTIAPITPTEAVARASRPAEP